MHPCLELDGTLTVNRLVAWTEDYILFNMLCIRTVSLFIYPHIYKDCLCSSWGWRNIESSWSWLIKKDLEKERFLYQAQIKISYRKTKYMDGSGIRCVNSNACAGFIYIYISRGLNKQLQMGECWTAMTYVLGKVDNLIGKSFQHWQNVHAPPRVLVSCCRIPRESPWLQLLQL